jgi:acyl-CoA thioesterase FadM
MIWLRMLWMAFTSRFRSKLNPTEEHRLTCRCLLTDIDLNGHMTNSRYLTYMDQVRFDMELRAGRRCRFLELGIYTVVGSVSIRFRHSIMLWNKFVVTGRVVTWDDRWLYIEQKILVGTELASYAIVRTAILNKNGRVPAEHFAEYTADYGPQPPLTELAKAKDALDKLLKP